MPGKTVADNSLFFMRFYFNMFYLLLQQAIDIREETPDMTAIRIFGVLRVLKYKPPTEYVPYV